MSSQRYDLHVHSTASDGLLPPREVVALAADRGLAGLALTDHDTVAGIAEARSMARALGVELITGIELSCTDHEHRQVHVLGLDFDEHSPAVDRLTRDMQQERLERAAEIAGRIDALVAVPFTMEMVLAESGGAAPGRPHIARAMVRMGIIGDVASAFSADWIGPGGRAWVHRAGTPISAAIDAIHQAGGVAVIAHPGRSRGGVRESAIRAAAAIGLDGIEVDHPDHGEDAIRSSSALAAELGLLQTSGSDDHGVGVDGPRLGCRTVPANAVTAIRTRAAQYRPA